MEQTEPAYTMRDKHAALAASCFAIFANPMAGSMLNLALGAIGKDFGCSEHSLAWVSSIYFLISLMAMLPVARLADIYGKRRVFLAGLALSMAGFILSMAAVDIYTLYIFRGFSAVGLAAVSGIGVAMIADVYDKHERGPALALNTACVYIGASIGPTFGGIITDVFGWRFIFLSIMPFLIASFICAMGFNYNIANASGEDFDVKGTVIYMAAVFLTMFGLISMPNIYAFIFIAVGIAFTITFVFYELKDDLPMLDVRIFRNSRFSRSIIAVVLNYAASYSVTYFISRYLIEIGAMTATQAGILMMVQPSVQVVATLVAGKLVDRMDFRILPTLGMAIISIALLMLMTMTVEVNVPFILVALIILGLGFGCFSSPNTTAAMSYVERNEYSKASAMIGFMRQTGMMLSMGLATCLISIYLGDAQLVPSNFDVFIKVLHVAFAVCLAFSVIGAFFSWFRGKAPKNIDG